MARSLISRIAVYIGWALIIFAGYGASFANETDEVNSGAAPGADSSRESAADRLPPVDVLLLLAAGLLSVIWGSVESIPELKSLSGIKAMNNVTRDEFLEKPSFRRYDTRASAIQTRLAGGRDRLKKA